MFNPDSTFKNVQAAIIAAVNVLAASPVGPGGLALNQDPRNVCNRRPLALNLNLNLD